MICPCCNSSVEQIDPAVFLAATRFGPVQREIINCMLEKFGKYQKSYQIAAYIYALDPNGGSLNSSNTVSVLIHRIRKNPALAACGVEIQSGTGGRGGYCMTWINQARDAA